MKWKFPSVEIDANDYLIVWADEDSLQGKLHANFKLSSDGEDLYLLNSDKVIIDKVSYGKQKKDLSIGRIPNGIGVFQNMDPTFAEPNREQSDSPITNSDTGFILEQNYPNPFNSNTLINYSINQSGNINLSVYNILGQRLSVLVDQFQAAGSYKINFKGSILSSGIYFYQLNTGDHIDTKKMLLVK